MAVERIDVAVVHATEATQFQKIFKGFKDFFQENSLKIDVKHYHLGSDKSNAKDIIKQIRKTQPRIVFSLGSSSLKTICTKLESELDIIGVSLRPVDFECAKDVGGVYLEYPPEVQLEWIQRILPKARNIGVIYSSDHNKQTIAEISQLAEKIGVTFLARQVSAPYQIPAALADLSNRADVLWGVSDSVVLTPETARKILLFSFQNKIPFVGLSKAWGKAGALYALDRDYFDIGRQCAKMVYEEIKGKQGINFGPQSPHKVNYYLNLKTAKHMKIDLSSSLLKEAEEIY